MMMSPAMALAGKDHNFIPPPNHFARAPLNRLMMKNGTAEDVEKYTTWIMGELLAGRLDTNAAQGAVRWVRAQCGVPE